MLNIDGEILTYVETLRYTLVDLQDELEVLSLIYYFIGATRRRDGTLTYRPRPSMEE